MMITAIGDLSARRFQCWLSVLHAAASDKRASLLGMTEVMTHDRRKKHQRSGACKHTELTSPSPLHHNNCPQYHCLQAHVKFCIRCVPRSAQWPGMGGPALVRAFLGRGLARLPRMPFAAHQAPALATRRWDHCWSTEIHGAPVSRTSVLLMPTVSSNPAWPPAIRPNMSQSKYINGMTLLKARNFGILQPARLRLTRVIHTFFTYRSYNVQGRHLRY